MKTNYTKLELLAWYAIVNTVQENAFSGFEWFCIFVSMNNIQPEEFSERLGVEIILI